VDQPEEVKILEELGHPTSPFPVIPAKAGIQWEAE
jgi:hypothetical protein